MAFSERESKSIQEVAKMRMLILAALMICATSVRAAISYQPTIDAYRQLSATPTVASVTVFTDGDTVGDRMDFAGAARKAGGQLLIRGMRFVSTISTTATLDCLIATRTFTGSANNEAFAYLPGEANNSFRTVVSVAAGDWTALGSGVSVAEKNDLDIYVDLPAGVDDLSAQMILRTYPMSWAGNNLVVVMDVAWLEP